MNVMKKIEILIFLFFAGRAFSQTRASLLSHASLDSCVQYALRYQPSVNQSLIDEQIASREIKSKLADWLPQINLNANYTNNFLLQKTVFGSNVISIGSFNASYAQFILNQTIFDRDVLLARTSANDVRLEFKQLTVNTRIAIVAAVSKAFYDVLLTLKQIDLISEDIVLLERSYRDAYNQYKGGIVDKTDFQRATITLNNAKSQKRTAEEQLKSKYATLKLLMSYPQDQSLEIVYDSAQLMDQALAVDTTLQVDYNNRIEYQLLLTQKRLLEYNLRYYKWGYLPTLSAFGQYNLNYFSNQFEKLYSVNYPTASAGLTLSFPIFQGTKRSQQVRMAELQLNRIDYDFFAMKDSISAEYTQSLSSYKSNLANYFVQKDNLALAREVFEIIRLQYSHGVKTYLDVVTANNDLFNAQINLVNAAFQVLINKIDVQRSLGTLRY